jgi:Putative Actinobacterial Holin-X, holin superfamily III
MRQREADQSLGELFSTLANEFSILVRQEVRLARVEVSQKASQLGRDIGFLAVGGLVAYAGLLAIVAAAVLGLAAAGLPTWLSAFLVGLVVAGVGYFLVRRGLDNLRQGSLAPQQTLKSLKESGEWAKDQMR